MVPLTPPRIPTMVRARFSQSIQRDSEMLRLRIAVAQRLAIVRNGYLPLERGRR